MDGKHTHEQIVDELIGHITKKDLVIKNGDQAVENPDLATIRPAIVAQLANDLEKYRTSHLFIA